MKKNKNANLHRAKSGKNDEFYTQLNDIENELRHYKEHFKDLNGDFFIIDLRTKLLMQMS